MPRNKLSAMLQQQEVFMTQLQTDGQLLLREAWLRGSQRASRFRACGEGVAGSLSAWRFERALEVFTWVQGESCQIACLDLFTREKRTALPTDAEPQSAPSIDTAILGSRSCRHARDRQAVADWSFKMRAYCDAVDHRYQEELWTTKRPPRQGPVLR